MAGEMFIALESTSQEIKTAVEGVKTDVANVDTSVDGVKTDTEGITLSNTSIKAIVDEIQNRIGLTTDTGGSDTAGSIMSKLNQIISAMASGGSGANFKFTLLKSSGTSEKNYTAQGAGIVIGNLEWDSDTSAQIKVDNQHGGVVQLQGSDNYAAIVIGMFTAGAKITSDGYNKEAIATAYIFEFI